MGDKKLTTAVYADLASPAFQEMGSVLGRAVRVALAPLRGTLWSFERVESWIQVQMEMRLRSVPPERILPPAPEVAVPVLMAITYTTAEELRTMFANLLATAMDSQTAEIAHPGFADIVRQMSPVDANVFSVLHGSGGRRFISGAELADVCRTGTRHSFELSISNLIRTGLIENIWSGRDTLTGAPEVYALPDSVVLTPDFHISEARSGKGGDVDRILNLTPWGDQFARACIRPVAGENED
jgi:hypothetical protein